MKNMNKKQMKAAALLTDQSLSEQQQKNKQNASGVVNEAEVQPLKEKRESRRKKLHSQMPFVERFKGKLFVFNKLGNMQKLERLQSFSIHTSNIINKIKYTNRNSLTKPFPGNYKNFMEINKTKISSRYQVSTKHTNRQTKSLDASKVSSVSRGQKYRYACKNFQIKEEQCEETIIKVPTQNITISTSSRLKNRKEKREVRSETVSKNFECQKHKKTVRRFFIDQNQQKTESSQNAQMNFNLTSLQNSSNMTVAQKEMQTQVAQQIAHFPKLKNKIKQYRMSKRHSKKYEVQRQIDLSKQKILPQIGFSRNRGQKQKQRLLTIR